MSVVCLQLRIYLEIKRAPITSFFIIIASTRNKLENVIVSKKKLENVILDE
jgi:hypothetical protein